MNPDPQPQRHDKVADEFGEPVKRAKPPVNPFMMALRVVASLRVTVVLFVLSLALVFFGTVDQIHKETFTVVDQYFQTWFVQVPFQIFADLGKVFLPWFVSPDAKLGGSFPFFAGYTLGWALLINLVAAHLVRFRFTWRRSGIVIIHSGVALLLLGEFFTREFAVEATMSMAEGEKVNFVDVSRNTELAFVLPSEPTVEEVIVVPERLLRKKSTIRDDRLPVDIRVRDFATNSRLEPTEPNDPEGVNFTMMEGRSGRVRFEPAKEESGASSGGRANAPMVYADFLRKGTDEVLGTYRLSMWTYPNYTKRTFQFARQMLKVDGSEYAVELRPKRIYKPYTIELQKFEHKVYEGTGIAKDFASTVKLTDPSAETEREVRIWMNHPMRHSGETFYQSQFFPDDSGTVLQVVQNPAAIIPYVSCSMIAGGMVAHFGILLLGFLHRRAGS